MPNVDFPTPQHRHHSWSRDADCSQDVSKTPGAIRGFFMSRRVPKPPQAAGLTKKTPESMKAPSNTEQVFDSEAFLKPSA